MRRLAIFTFLLCLLCGCVEEYGQDQHIIGFYNLENLFDIYDDPQKNDEDFLPDGRNEWTEERYRKKLANMAEVINEMAIENGMWHTVLGVCEVENIPGVHRIGTQGYWEFIPEEEAGVKWALDALYRRLN